MIFTHSYNMKKAAGILLENNIIENRVYFNKIHILGKDLDKVINQYKENDFEVIYESPIYISGFVNKNSSWKEIKKRKLDKEILSKNIIHYIQNKEMFLKELQNIWNEYSLNCPKGVSKVLTLPSINTMTQKYWKDIINSINYEAKYKYISIAINYRTIEDQKNEYKKMMEGVLEIAKKMQISSILFTIKTPLEIQIYNKEQIKTINKVIEFFSINNIEVIIHHSNSYIPYLPSRANLSLGPSNQTKSLSPNQLPFTEQENAIKRSKSNSIFSHYLMTEFKIDKLITENIKNNTLGNKEEWQKLLQIVEKQYIKNVEKIKTEVTRTKNMLNDFIEYKKILDADINKKIEITKRGCYFFNQLKKSDRKLLVYKISALLYEKVFN